MNWFRSPTTIPKIPYPALIFLSLISPICPTTFCLFSTSVVLILTAAINYPRSGCLGIYLHLLLVFLLLPDCTMGRMTKFEGYTTSHLFWEKSKNELGLFCYRISSTCIFSRFWGFWGFFYREGQTSFSCLQSLLLSLLSVSSE